MRIEVLATTTATAANQFVLSFFLYFLFSEKKIEMKTKTKSNKKEKMEINE